mgnify:CR=1 FL=1
MKETFKIIYNTAVQKIKAFQTLENARVLKHFFGAFLAFAVLIVADTPFMIFLGVMLTLHAIWDMNDYFKGK